MNVRQEECAGVLDRGEPEDRLSMRDGERFAIPGVRGRMEKLAFGTGLFLHLAELEVEQDAFFAVENYMAPGWIGGSWNILGELQVQPPGMAPLSCGESDALIMRVDTTGTRYLLPAGQLIRHIGVTCTLESLRQRFNGSLPVALAPFVKHGADVVDMRVTEVTPRMRSVGAAMFARQLHGAGRRFQLEGLATLFLYEIIDSFCEGLGDDSEDLPDWEQVALERIMVRIQQDPGAPLVARQLADEMGMAETRLNNLFKIRTGKRCAEFIRAERMALARRLIEEGELALKQVALRAGFNHVSNFSRAYKSWYGENPGRAQRRR